VVHLHLINNGIIDLSLLPLMTKLKPTVWTLHDPWALGGHCVHHYDCQKWQTHCGDCPYLSSEFPLTKDNSALNFYLKKQAILDSKLDIIVASQWMLDQVKTSPLFKHCHVHLIPFGINLNLFKPMDKRLAKIKIGLDPDSVVLMFRADYSEFKGMDYIEDCLRKLKINHKRIVLVSVGFDALREPRLRKKYKYLIKPWIKDDVALAEIYNAADILLMPSKIESFGMMAIEAMACGTVPITIEGTVLKETINAPHMGVCTQATHPAFNRAVANLIEDNSDRNLRAKLGSAWVKKHYSHTEYVDKIIRVYRQAMRRHSLGPEETHLLNQLNQHLWTKASNLDNPTKLLTPFHRWLLRSFFVFDKAVPVKIRQKVKQSIKSSAKIQNFFRDRISW
jgi:glycosyltransferase involved in cell wall biosynthesis